MKTAICKRCHKEFEYDMWTSMGMFCSKECRKRPQKAKRFLWANATPEEKRARFQASLDKNTVKKENGCLEWTGNKYTNGYGKMGILIKGSRITAHRAAYISRYGDIPARKFVLHKCDNRACCAPEHLFIGDQSVNIRDMHAKGRNRINGKRKNDRLVDEQVCQIKTLLKAGESRTSIAKKFRVCASTIGWIARDQTWRHITLSREE